MWGFDVLESRRLLAFIANGGFDAARTDGTPADWEVVGDVSAVTAGGRAVLFETIASTTRLQQEFTVPSGVFELQFDIHAVALEQATAQPPDTLEVALLDAQTSLPLLDTLPGVGEADALLSWAADGRLSFGSDTHVAGTGSSGELFTPTFPVNVQIDLSGVPAGTAAVLVFEILGFGEADSQVTVDDVRLGGDVAPQITLGLDPSTDTGVLGDGFTQAAVINLVGKGPSGEEVELDLDGDGYDDGVAIIDGAGDFRFTAISLEGELDVAVRASNEFGETVVERRVIRDSDPPVASIAAPRVDRVLTEDLGFLEVVWDDAGQSGVDLSSLGADDVQIDGVDVERIEILPEGRVRYWYADDGDRLPYGPVRIEILSNAVQDQAGNASAPFITSVDHVLDSCGWQNVSLPVDTTGDSIVASRDVLVVINEINRRPLTTEAARLPPLPPITGDFFWYDVDCDSLITPRDVLIIINFINRQ